MFYEIVYETGRMSVASYESDEEAQSAIKAHNDRALTGQPGGPIGQPAERISAVYVYSEHPNEFNPEQTMSADVFEKEVGNLIKERKDKNGVVSIQDMAGETRGLSHPMTEPEGFKSRFKMKEDRKLQLTFLEA